MRELEIEHQYNKPESNLETAPKITEFNLNISLP